MAGRIRADIKRKQRALKRQQREIALKENLADEVESTKKAYDKVSKRMEPATKRFVDAQKLLAKIETGEEEKPFEDELPDGFKFAEDLPANPHHA
jgi:CRISPR/Cas system CMR subunit Cmr6 (Cas7 group RAMP superfamily)